MPDEDVQMMRCYNNGCGQTFDPKLNTEDSCTYHSGTPFFHDAYKGWTCCKKKCTDFTEFLNIKGCTKSFHNHVKPPEAEKPVVDTLKDITVPKQQSLERPSFDSPLVSIPCTVAPVVKELVATLKKTKLSVHQAEASMPAAPEIGTICKNPACNKSYEGPCSDETPCQFHNGIPIFHEGSKFWSCCKKRTADFEAFLSQKGCLLSKHCWEKKKEDDHQVTCRYDWHQTSSHVVVAVYAKRYNHLMSKVQISPVRLVMEVDFPEEGRIFNLDLELHGIVDVSRSTASMFGTKIEVNMRKAEPGLWTKLNFPKSPSTVAAALTGVKPISLPVTQKSSIGPGGDVSPLNEDFEAVDLSDL